MPVVLLVEKDPTLRSSYAAALVEDGYEVIAALDYHDALAKNLLHRPDVVILDPGTDRRGMEAAAELTRVNKHVYLVLHTQNALQVGTDFSAWVADAVAPKSGDPSVLLSALRRHAPPARTLEAGH